MTTDLDGLTAVALVGRHEFDAAMAVPVVVPVDKRRHPLAGLLLAAKLLPNCECLTCFIAGCSFPAVLYYHLSCFISQEMCGGCTVRFLFGTICKSGYFSIRRPRFTMGQIRWQSDTNSPLVAFRFVLICDRTF